MPPNCTADAYNSKACSATKLGGSFKNPESVAVDASGNVYVSDPTAQQVYEMTPDCASSSCVRTLGGGFNSPNGVAVDASGNVYVADGNTVYEMPPGCISSGCVTTLDGDFQQPYGLALDSSGNLYVSDDIASLVHEIVRYGGVNFSTTPVGNTGRTVPLTFTFDSAGTIGAPKVLTEGAAGLDFADARTGSCTTNGTGHHYNATDACTVNVTFAPKFAGERNGAMGLVNSSGTVIASFYVYGTGTGPQVLFGPGARSQVVGGLNIWFQGLAVDGAGNVYAAGAIDNSVYEIPSGCTSGGCVTTLGGGFNNPEGVAVDGAGNVYVAAQGSGVAEIPPGCASSSCQTNLGGGLYLPAGVAVDADGNVYVADTGNNAVKKMPPGCIASAFKAGKCSITTLGGGFNNPLSVAVDSSGNVYVVDQNSVVKEIPPACTSADCVVKLGGGLSATTGVALDAGGNVYVADNFASEVKEIPSGCTSSSCVITLWGDSSEPQPYGVAVDAGGNVYFSFSDAGAYLEKLNRATPPSLSFAATPIGNESSDSPQTVILQNIGNTALIFPVPKTGSNPNLSSTSFTLGSGTTCPRASSSSSEAATLDAGTICELSIEFLPLTAGAITGSVTLTDNALNANPATQSISLSGTGQQLLGSSGGGSNFTLTDTGTASQTVQPGAAATYTLQLAPSSGSYPGSVTFSATGLPTGATAVFSPSTLAAGAGKQTITLTVKTASSLAKKNNPFATEAPFALALLLLPALGLRRVRCSLLLVLFAVATFAGLASLSGCGGGSNPPPADYTITVTAASGQLTQSVNVQLEVQ
jgi:large repetitive protein